MKKPTIGKVKGEVWALMSLQIREEVRQCQRCGATEGLQVHHIIARSRGNSVYFLRDNLIVLCKSCHYWWHNVSSPGEMKDTIITIIGKKKWNAIEKAKNTYLKYTIRDLEEMYESLQKKLLPEKGEY